MFKRSGCFCSKEAKNREVIRTISASLVLLMLSVWTASASASRFSFPLFGYDIGVNADTKVTAGVGIRTEPQNAGSIAKNHLNPNVCGRSSSGHTYYQDCQGVQAGQGFLGAHLTAAPGQFSDNFDQGDLNYRQGDITQAPLRLDEQLLFHLPWQWKLYADILAFYDPVNSNFTEYNPSLITKQNYLQSGYTSFPGDEVLGLGIIQQTPSILSPLLSGLPQSTVTQLLQNPTAIPGFTVRNDSTGCPPNRNPTGQPCGIVYGPGQAVYYKRTDQNTLHEIGRAIDLLDFNLSGPITLPNGRSLLVKVGRQNVIWGGALLEFFDSVNVLNPPNLNNFFRIGSDGLDDFYQPLNALSFAYQASDSLNFSGWYDLEWEPIQLPGAGSFYSPVNINTQNGGQNYLTAGFANTPQDSSGMGFLLDNPLSTLTNTSSTIPRIRDQSPNSWNNFGLRLKYSADWLNNGTDFSFYFANYTSRTPFISFWSADQSCAKNTTNTAEFVLACPDVPLLHAITHGPNDPQGATNSILNFNSLRFQLQYPKSIQMFGLSFNTNFGDVSVQGEAAFRPRDPLQVDVVDLAFAALGPTLSNCDHPPGCLGTPASFGTGPNGTTQPYGSSDYTTKNGKGAYNDTYPLVIGALPGAGRSFPNFITPYRGGVLGENPPNSYIRGWEYFKTLSLDFGATYISGPSNPVTRFLGADQIVWLGEVGARGILDLPPLDELALAVPGTYTSPTAGADGSGANGSRQACSTNQACQYGPDGLRFNPHQAPLNLYPTSWSGGYGAVILIRWDSLFSDFAIDPQFIFKHDVYGHSPGYFSNYVQGRILFQPTLTVTYRQNFAVNLRYRMWAGGGDANLFRDRDEASIYFQYEF